MKKKSVDAAQLAKALQAAKHEGTVHSLGAIH